MAHTESSEEEQKGRDCCCGFFFSIRPLCLLLCERELHKRQLCCCFFPQENQFAFVFDTLKATSQSMSSRCGIDVPPQNGHTIFGKNK